MLLWIQNDCGVLRVFNLGLPELVDVGRVRGAQTLDRSLNGSRILLGQAILDP